jgi:hypothetical protein
VAVTALTPRHGDQRWPQFLPDGSPFPFLVRSAVPTSIACYVEALDGAEVTRGLATASTFCAVVTADQSTLGHPGWRLR